MAKKIKAGFVEKASGRIHRIVKPGSSKPLAPYSSNRDKHWEGR